MINSNDKFIAARFILEYSKKEFASLLGVSISSITNIEAGTKTIPPIYNFAINYLLETSPYGRSAIESIKSNDTLFFSTKVNTNAKIYRLNCKKCHSRALHIMTDSTDLYFVQCLDCKHNMYCSGLHVKRYKQWTKNPVKLDYHLYRK